MMLTSPTSRMSEPPIRIRRRRSGSARQGAGFTLAELVVVLTIVAILFFALVPAIGGMVKSARERTALRGIVGLLNYARTDAVTKGRLVRVVCDTGEGTLWAEAQVDPSVDRSEFDRLRVLGRAVVRVPETLAITGLTISGGDAAAESGAQIYFYPDGRTDGAVLAMVSQSGREVLIQLSPATGRVHLAT